MKLSSRFFLALLLLFPVAAAAQTYTAALLGTNETSNCDPDGTGSATVTFTGTTVNYTINVANIVLPPTMQHIHIGAAGVDGGVVITLTGTWVGGTLTGTTTSDAATVAAIHANPAGYYVNVHNTPCPGGAVRGQLVPVAAAIPTFSGGTLLLLAAVLAMTGLLVLKRL